MAGKPLKPMVSVLRLAPEPRVIEKKSLNMAEPLILKSSTRNEFEIRNLFVARKVKPISPSVFRALGGVR